MGGTGIYRRAGVLLATTALLLASLSLGAAPANADTLGTSQTEVFVVGDTEVAYGENLRIWARVTDVSDSCENVGSVGCDHPFGRVDFYAVAGTEQRFMLSGDLAAELPRQTSTETLDYCCLPVGSYDSIRGYFVPNTFDPSSGDSAAVRVVRNGSTITLQGSPTTARVGERVEFNVHLAGYASGPGVIKPGGTVDVYEGATNYGTAFVDANGDATITTTQLPLGRHDLRARWGGDDRWTASTSAPLRVTVGGGTTSTILGSSTTATTYGAAVTLTGTVSAVNPPGGTPTGVVGFHDGNAFVGPGTLDEASPNRATLTTNELGVGSHALYAVYTGDGVYLASTSDVVMVNVSKASTTTSVSSSANPASFGQAVTFTATVDGPGTTTVPGTVQFRDGSANLGPPQALVLGQATLTIPTLSGGAHAITAVYSGSANYLGSTSSPLSQTVACDRVVTGTAGNVTALAGGSTCLSGARVTGSVTVPSGSSLSVVNSTINGSVTVNGGVVAAGATLRTANVASGAVTICGSTLNGSLRVLGATGFVLVGDRLEDACAGNVLKGGLSITGSSGGLAVADNRISGSVTIARNTGSGPAGHGAPEVEANTISGYLWAYGNTPRVTDDGRPNSVKSWTLLD